jgi:hypothetical protein
MNKSAHALMVMGLGLGLLSIQVVKTDKTFVF